MLWTTPPIADTGAVPEGNVDVVKQLMLAYQRADFPTALGILDPEVRVYPRSEEPGVDDVYVGHDGVFQYLGNWLGQWDEYETDPVSFEDAPDDQVLVVMTERGHMKQSEITLNQEFTHSFKVKGGTVTEWRMYDSNEQGRDAVGLG